MSNDVNNSINNNDNNNSINNNDNNSINDINLSPIKKKNTVKKVTFVDTYDKSYAMHEDKRPWNVIAPFQHVEQYLLKAEYLKYADNSAIACLNICSDANIGLMIRDAASFGIGKVYIIGRRKFPAHTAVGTHNHIPVDRLSASKGPHDEFLDIEKISSILSDLSEKYTIVFIEQSPDAIPLQAFQQMILSKPPLFVFGTESDGIPKELLKGTIVYIEQAGIGRSLNVSVACGIICYNWRQRNPLPSVT